MNAAPVPSLNPFQRLVRCLVKHAKVSFLLPLLRRWHGHRPSPTPLAYLQALPPGTLGRAVADTLQAHGFQLIPNYENHDLKHALLGYGMTVEAELQMQAFMLGNGNYAPTCWGFLLFGLLTPEHWPELRRHYRRGRRVQPVHSWQLADYAAESLAGLRRRIGLTASAG